MTVAPQEQDVWQFPASISGPDTGIVDGDTLDLRVDLGFYVDRRVRVRLDGVDTAETYGVSHESEEYQEGLAHKKFVTEWLAAAEDRHDGAWPLIITTEQATGKYGRWVADVQRVHDSQDLRDALVDAFGDAVIPDD